MSDEQLIKTPVKYIADSDAMIFDADGKHILDIRGWGYLTGTGSLNLSNNEAAAIQDAQGQFICNAINSYAQARCCYDTHSPKEKCPITEAQHAEMLGGWK